MNSSEQDFRFDPASIREVRRFVSRHLPDDDSRDDIVLVASELATNVVRHAQTPYTVRIIGRDDGVRLEVSDGSSVIPAVADLNEHRSGLRILENAADSWGVEATSEGKTVWVEFASGANA